MLDQIKDLIEQGKISVKESVSIILKINSTYRSLYNLLYGNLMTNFESNLTEENLEEYKIPEKEYKKILQDFERWFQKADEVLRNPEQAINENNDLKKEDYLKFKQEIKKRSSNSYNLLLDIEKSIEYPVCEKEINKFEDKVENIIKKIQNLSKEI